MSIVTSTTVTTVIYDAHVDELLENQMAELNIGNDPTHSDNEDPEQEDEDCYGPIPTPPRTPTNQVIQSSAPELASLTPPRLHRITETTGDECRDLTRTTPLATRVAAPSATLVGPLEHWM